MLDKYGLQVFAISIHLKGQAVCDDPIDRRHRDMLPDLVWGDGDPEGVRQRAAEQQKNTARRKRFSEWNWSTGVHVTHDEVDLRLQVTARSLGAEGVVVLEMRDPSGAELPAWSPGAHIDLRLPGSRGLVRQYSHTHDPAGPTRRVLACRLTTLCRSESHAGGR